MSFLIKLVALVALAGIAVPLVAGNTPLGQILRAVWSDAASFCERRPDACAEGVALARDAGTFLSETLKAIGDPGEPAGTLTAEDRNIRPLDASQSPAHDAFAGHGAPPRS